MRKAFFRRCVYTVYNVQWYSIEFHFSVSFAFFSHFQLPFRIVSDEQLLSIILRSADNDPFSKFLIVNNADQWEEELFHMTYPSPFHWNWNNLENKWYGNRSSTHVEMHQLGNFQGKKKREFHWNDGNRQSLKNSIRPSNNQESTITIQNKVWFFVSRTNKKNYIEFD